jgi:hypothetical protein
VTSIASVGRHVPLYSALHHPHTLLRFRISSGWFCQFYFALHTALLFFCLFTSVRNMKVWCLHHFCFCVLRSDRGCACCLMVCISSWILSLYLSFEFFKLIEISWLCFLFRAMFTSDELNIWIYPRNYDLNVRVSFRVMIKYNAFLSMYLVVCTISLCPNMKIYAAEWAS